MYYFYCPKCGYEDHVKTYPRGTVANVRDGYGIPILHYECPICHNLDAGYMRCTYRMKPDDIMWYQHVIGMYQGIRGYTSFFDVTK